VEPLERLEREIQTLIVDSLALEDLEPTDIDPTAPLFGEGLGLDSIDALEIAGVLERRYGVRAEGSEEQNRERYASVRNLALWVAQAREARSA
jgi:acyl carrier protein